MIFFLERSRISSLGHRHTKIGQLIFFVIQIYCNSGILLTLKKEVFLFPSEDGSEGVRPSQERLSQE